MADDKQPSFAERTAQMYARGKKLREVATALTEIAVALDAEADQMTAAQKRFAERRADKRKAGK